MTEVTIEITSPPALTISVEAPGTNTIEVSPAPVVEIDVNVSGPSGPADHGLLTGLADNDHPQYVLKAGDTMTGMLRIIEGANLKGVKTWWGNRDALRITDSGGANLRWIECADPQTASEAATRGYVDNTRIGRNRIINGDFSVNQRAFTSVTADNAFGHDRWKISGSTGITYSTQTAVEGTLPGENVTYARVATVGQAAAGDFAALVQKIENVRTLHGKQVAISFWAKASSGTPSIAVNLLQDMGAGGAGGAWNYIGKIALTTSWVRYSLVGVLPSMTGKTPGTNHFLALYLFTSAGSSYNTFSGSLGIQNTTIDIWGVQVEETVLGGGASAFERLTYAEQLRACQRYCRVFSGGVVEDIVASTTGGLYTDANQLQMAPNGWDIRTLRTYPTITTVGVQGTNWGIWSAGGVAQTGFTLSSPVYSSIVANKAGHGLGSAGNLKVATGGRIIFDAEL